MKALQDIQLKVRSTRGGYRGISFADTKRFREVIRGCHILDSATVSEKLAAIAPGPDYHSDIFEREHLIRARVLPGTRENHTLHLEYQSYCNRVQCLVRYEGSFYSRQMTPQAAKRMFGVEIPRDGTPVYLRIVVTKARKKKEQAV